MKKSINLWAFPYPAKMSLKECFELARRAGFDAVEVNYNLEGDLSPAAGEKELADIHTLADKAGVAISGVCSFLFWPYPLTANNDSVRAKSLEIASKFAPHYLPRWNLLVVPGAGHPGSKIRKPYKSLDEQAAAIKKLLPEAER
jgi:hexulose-6-phosphate isomerase